MEKLSLQDWRARPRSVVAIYPGMYTMAYLTMPVGVKEWGVGVNSVIAVLAEKDFEFFVESKENCEELGSLLLEKFKTDPTYLDKLIKLSVENQNLLYDFISANLNSEIIGTLSNIELAERYSKYIDQYVYFHLKQTPAWWVATTSVEKELRRLLSEAGQKDIDSIIPILIDPLEYQSENFKEEIALLDIAIKAKKSGLGSVESDLDQHVKIYSSIPFGYITGVVWDKNYFVERLNKLLTNDPESLKAAKLSEVKEKLVKRDKLATELNLSPEIMTIVIALRKLAYLQEVKKTTQTRSHPLLQLVVHKEIAERIGTDWKYMQYLSVNDIVPALNDGSLPQTLKGELVERDRFSVVIIEKGKERWLIGEDAKEFVKVNEIALEIVATDTIKGSIASRGKAIGKVKVCESSTEINKVEEGDILVTAMTTPDFVPAMRLAGAIVTNEGGVTCHAAIVSRELNKPCVIGTKNATKILKDGMMVEVDANTGTVKIITKHE